MRTDKVMVKVEWPVPIQMTERVSVQLEMNRWSIQCVYVCACLMHNQHQTHLVQMDEGLDQSHQLINGSNSCGKERMMMQCLLF